MPQSVTVKIFIETVCSQIKSKRTRGFIANELIAHIEDQKTKYIKEEKMSEKDAEERAVWEMGDPLTIGEEYNKTRYFKGIDIELIANIIMWIIAGIIASAGIIFGIGIIIVVGTAHPEDSFAAVIIGLGIVSFGAFLDFSFITFCKLIFNSIFFGGLVRDYKKRKKRGELHSHRKY